MAEVIIWFKANWSSILEIIGAVVTVASLIVKITPTDKDNKVFYSIINFIAKFSIFNTKIDSKILEEAKNSKEDK